MSSDENNENKNNEKENDTSIATCNQCGFSASPEEFDACLSPYHDLRCPECGTTDVDWTNGIYKDNTLVTNIL